MKIVSMRFLLFDVNDKDMRDTISYDKSHFALHLIYPLTGVTCAVISA